MMFDFCFHERTYKKYCNKNSNSISNSILDWKIVILNVNPVYSVWFSKEIIKKEKKPKRVKVYFVLPFHTIKSFSFIQLGNRISKLLDTFCMSTNVHFLSLSLPFKYVLYKCLLLHYYGRLCARVHHNLHTFFFIWIKYRSK